jgi:hypothetical protein
MKKKNQKRSLDVADSVGPVFGRRPSCGIWLSGAFGRADPCQLMRRATPQRGHRAQRDRGGAAPTGGMDDVVRGGGRFELEESKGEAPDMEEGAESHRGGAAPVAPER